MKRLIFLPALFMLVACASSTQPSLPQTPLPVPPTATVPLTPTLIPPTLTNIPPTFTPLPTATSIPPTPTLSPTATAIPIPFLVINAKNGEEEKLSADNEKLRGIIEQHLDELYGKTSYAGLALNYGDPRHLVFLYFTNGIGDLHPLRLQKIEDRRYEISFSGSYPSVWNNLLRNFALFPLPDPSTRMVYNIKENVMEYLDSKGIITDRKSPPNYEALLPHCEPGGQEAFAWDIGGLEVHSLCVRLSGTVKSISQQGEANGDFTFEVALDPPFASYINEENSKVWNGYLHVAIVCHKLAGAGANTCANFPEALHIAPPEIGQHIWMEGQWVENWNKTGWSELNPLFRWEPFK